MTANRARLIYDRYFFVAIITALPFWIGLYWLDAAPLSIDWIGGAPWLFLSLVLFQPVLEEIVFRGVLQGYVFRRAWGQQTILGLSLANIVTSFIFVLMHLFYHAPLMAMLVIVPSLAFGYFRDRYDGWLLPSMLLHCFYNAGYFVLYGSTLKNI